MTANPLTLLQEHGQSVWYDNIGRDLLLSGGLKRMVDQDGVVGLTSNPSIFQKAIAQSADYDEAVAALVAEGADVDRILDTLVGGDVRMAADLLGGVFESTGTVDGWVSIEVAPSLAYDTEGSVAEAHRLRELVGRPNILVKVPATLEGVPAIERLIGDGVSVNVTLIFSIERYRAVMEAYLSGMERLVARSAAGEDLPAPESVRSVASFFVSRVDTMVDARLEAAAAEESARGETILALKGRAAVANAKLAYQAFQTTFAGSRWDSLSAAGARVQRPLWASTSTKNPEYRDVMYVERLIGPDTVNTMPQSTLDAFRDHGVVADTLTEGVDEARADLEALEDMGVSMGEVTARLEIEGVKAFADAFDSLMETLRAKREGSLLAGA